MSLQVWLPLISDVNSIGLNRNTVTPHNITYGSAKLGNGAILNGSNGYIEGSIYTTATMTYMCWVYFTTLGGCHLLDCRTPAGNGYQPMYINPSTGVQVGGSTSGYPYIAYTFAASTWYHIAVTYSATKCQLFINGQLVGESTSGKGTAINDNRPFYLGCRCTQVNWAAAKINDFRIYDHTCSAKEVEEASRALFVHYKMDNANPNVVYDCSGYKHNATAVGENYISVTNQSVRYGLATHFNGSYIRMNDRPSVLPKESITVNMWVNFSTWGNPISCTEGGGWNFEEAGGGIRFPIYIASVGYKVAQSTTTSASLKNSWHMLTGTMDSTNVKIYIDGELAGTTAIGSTNGVGYANNYLFIAAEAAGNQTPPASIAYRGDISDVRIYASALVDKQIKELYNESVAIAKDSGIFAREFVETTSISVKKNGQLTANSFQETGNTAYFKKNGTIKSSDIYEY